MSDTRPTNFSSVWSDLRGVSFKQHYIDAGGLRYCAASNDLCRGISVVPSPPPLLGSRLLCRMEAIWLR